jgi:quinol monooxygenase YgiN
LFIVVYHYRIPTDKAIDYIRLEKKAIDFYIENGGVRVELYRDSQDPQKWIEINRFEDEDHYKIVSSTMNEDPRISQLFEEFKVLLRDVEYDPEKNTYYQMI